VQQRAGLNAEHRDQAAATAVLERARDDEQDGRAGDQEQYRGGGREQREGVGSGHAGDGPARRDRRT
jgi:hypothetical protein